MTRLLVSVRNAEEALDALAGGAAIIDVKEPQRGALGCADARVLREVAQSIGERALLSAALGELANPPRADSFAALQGFRFAKVGLAGMRREPAWPAKWSELTAQLPPGVALVAVIYADWKLCNAPSPDEVLARVMQMDCAALLVDTYFKNGRSALESMSLEELRDTFARSQSEELTTVLAGSLGLSDLSEIAALSPHYLGVRGAVCDAGREGRLQTVRVAQLVRALNATANRGPFRTVGA